MRILLSILLILVFVPSWTGEPRIPRFGPKAQMTLRPLGIAPGLRSGRLTYLNGWELHSNDPAFGGFGAIAVAGDRFTLLSDGGALVRFTLGGDGIARGVRFGALPNGPGSGWRKEHRDSESLAIDPATGTAWAGFEPSEGLPGSIWRYADGFDRALGHVEPEAMRGWPVNAGAETLVRLRSGQFVSLSERATERRKKPLRAILFDRDPVRPDARAFGFFYRPPVPRSFPTDAAQLPDGNLVVLNRSASLKRWFRGNVAIVRRSDIRPGAIVAGTLVGRIAPPLPQDNYEGVAVTRERGDTILWIVSDDNESILQRSLLLKFRLEPPAPRRGTAP
ncbi:esterase-like activity of phytase family protein [Sphingomonas japonica]|uniref:Phytase-like domain-containing protein n=1 Tax=Sphingomonas japonica TaxID=511662 RepID=A0ABX0TYE2_9SPHN|nr:esterase-like activity of phytase family protein [Sphingomonas japonica]NIJ23248.1 hypothetical protein [Sphingomonas japonica]